MGIPETFAGKQYNCKGLSTLSSVLDVTVFGLYGAVNRMSRIAYWRRPWINIPADSIVLSHCLIAFVKDLMQ